MHPPTDIRDLLQYKSLHPQIEAKVKSYIAIDAWDDAVTAAFKVLENHLRKACGDTHGYGIDLVNKCFDDKVGILTDYTIPPAERTGMLLFFRSSFLLYRNPLAHRFVDLTRDKAVDLLILVNHLVNIVEERKRQSTGNRSAALSIPRFRYGWNWGPLVLDTDGDGETEIVSRSRIHDRVIEISKNTDGVLREQEVQQPPLINDMHFWFFSDAASLDMDGDSSIETVCFCEGATQGSSLLILRYTNGRYVLPPFDPSSPEDALTYAPWFADASLIDFDNDGYIEVASKPYISIPPDIVEGLTIPQYQENNPSGRMLYVWKWQRDAGFYKLIHRSFIGFGKWDFGNRQND